MMNFISAICIYALLIVFLNMIKNTPSKKQVKFVQKNAVKKLRSRFQKHRKKAIHKK